jgi:lysophospholipase L1-like esterase
MKVQIMFIYVRLAIVFCFISLSCASPKHSSTSSADLPATALKPFGRTIINPQKNLELISSAVHFGFNFEGSECKVYASHAWKGGHNYIQYELDGDYQKRIRVEGDAMQPIVISAAKAGKHTVWIYKATEAHTGAVVIQKITGQNIKPLETPSAPIIEFIGNSITCGAAADASETPCGKGEYHDQHSAYMAYGPQVAKALHANFIVSSVSGIGIYRNWNSDGPTMPQVYEKVDFQANNLNQWNFETYKPKVVSIALGTNDFSRGDGIKKRLPFDSSAFISAYVKFVQLIKTKYPAARIAILSSPMVGGDDRLLLQACLATIKQHVDALYRSDKPVAMYFFEPMQPHGCSGHPSVDDHKVLAKELTPFFKALL